MASHRTARDDHEAVRLQALGPSGLAWQWLRRDPDYKALGPGSASVDGDGIEIRAPLSHTDQLRWGCLAFEDPSVARAPILWSAAVDPSVLIVEAVRPRPGDRHLFDLRRWASMARFVTGEGGEHLLLGDGPSSIRIDIAAGSIQEGPVRLRHPVGWGMDSARHIVTLRHFVQLCRTGRLTSQRPLMGRPHRRALAALDVHDALIDGASIRDIGILLFGADRIRAEWSAPGESLKSSCRRWIKCARKLAVGGYKALLR